MDTFGQCGLPLLVIHKRLLVKRTWEKTKKKEFMEGGVSQHGGGSHGGAYYTDLEVAEFLKAVSGKAIFG